MKNQTITIISISLFAFLLWGYISLSGDYRATINAKIHVAQLPYQYGIGSISDNNVTIRVKAQGWELAKLTLDANLTYDVSARNDSGKHSVLLRDEIEQNSEFSSAIQILEIIPQKIDFVVEKVTSKKVPIKSDMKFNYKTGYGLVSDLILTPDSVTIIGPKSIVSKIDSLPTVTKVYNNLSKSLNENIALEKIINIKYSTDYTKVKCEIEKIVDITFKDIEVQTKNVPYEQSIRLLPSRVDVVLRGGIERLSKVERKEISSYVTYKQAKEDTLGYLIPTVNYPPFTTLIKTNPTKLKYMIKQF